MPRSRPLIMGLVACWLTAAGVSWVRLAFTKTMRIDEVAPVWAASILPQFALGVLAAIGAALYWRIYTAAGKDLDAHESAGADRARPLLWGGLAVGVAASLSLPLTTNDIFSNLAYGRLTALGYNPYRTTPQWLPADDPFGALVGSRWRNTPTVYGPILAAANSLVGRASTVPGAMMLFKMLASMAVLGSVLIAYRICRTRSFDGPSRASFVLYAFSPVLLWELSAQAHNDAFMVLAMVGFVWAATQGREWAATICLSMALYTKLAVAPLLAFYLFSVARREPLRAAAMALAIVAIGVLLLAPYWDGIETLRGPLATAGGNMSRTARSFGDLACLVAMWISSSAQSTAYRVFWVGGLVVLGLLFIRGLIVVRSTEDAIHHALVLLGAYCLFASPWFQPWYVTWLLPLALVHRDERWQRITALYGAVTPVQYILPLDPITTAVLNIVVLAKAMPLVGVHWSLPGRRPAS
jgi:hypothetical protein